jgi:hypothetical protein
MDSNPRRLTGILLAVVALLGAAAASSQGKLDDDAPTFMKLENLANGLVPNVVRIKSKRDEHGLGLIVGSDDEYMYIVTAQHVVEDENFKRSTSSITVTPCSEENRERSFKGTVLESHGDNEDFAFIRASRPKNLKLNTRAIAPEAHQALRDEAVAIGGENKCALNARDSRISKLRDGFNNLRVEVPNGVGGDSGGPVLTARGVIGIVTEASGANLTLQSIAYIKQLAPKSVRWDLVDSRNIPPTSPDAAQQDLTRTLNQYLWSMRNVQRVLLASPVDKKHFDEYAKSYGSTIEHYFEVRDVYDGTLNEYWGLEVLNDWKGVSSEVWKVHQTFLALNSVSLEIWNTGITPIKTRDSLIAVEPDMDRLQESIMRFTSSLGARRKTNESK